MAVIIYICRKKSSQSKKFITTGGECTSVWMNINTIVKCMQSIFSLGSEWKIVECEG
jgi:hypothetical protein